MNTIVFQGVSMSCLTRLTNSKVVVEGRPSTTPSKPCVRLSPHTAFPFGVAFKDTLGINTTLLMILLIASPKGDLGIFQIKFKHRN